MVRAEENVFHGGAIRVYATHRSKNQTLNSNYQKYPSESSVLELKKFAKQVKKYRREFRELLGSLQGKKIVGFGAPAKGVALLNYCGIRRSQIAYIVDATPMKQGRYMPGVQVPIFPEEKLWNDAVPPEYVLLLSWNYKKEILAKLQKHLNKKVKVIVPFPSLAVGSL